MEELTPDEAAALVERQDALQAEAAELLVDLDLLDRLGEATLIGSAALGLMVWRDLDIHVSLPRLDPEVALGAMQAVLIDPRVTQVRYLDETGPDTIDDDPRLYFAVRLRTVRGAEWKLDIAFWPNERVRREAAFVGSVLARLTPETRLAILWIKDVWHRSPEYHTTVTGMDIYGAVLDHGIRAPSGFREWLRTRGARPGC